MEDDKIRLLILGDSGVGKTCLLHLLCNGTIPKKSPAWTIGCNFDVLIHNYKNKSYFIEFCDVGGSIRYANARSVFYKDVDGVILVHDLSNIKTFQHLKIWFKEVLKSLSNKETQSSKIKSRRFASSTDHTTKGSENIFQYYHKSTANITLPVLIIGNKSDLVLDKQVLADENGNDAMNISCKDPNTFAPGTDSYQKIRYFFDKVILRKYFSPQVLNHTPSAHDSVNCSSFLINDINNNNNSLGNNNNDSGPAGTHIHRPRRRSFASVRIDDDVCSTITKVITEKPKASIASSLNIFLDGEDNKAK
jgi:Rab-like protein 3